MKKFAKENWLELLFVIFVLSLWLVWAWILPFNEGPDEYMRSQIVEYIIEYGKLPTGYQKEIMDPSWGFTYGFRPILPQILEALFIRVGMLFTKDAFLLLFIGRLASILCGLIFIGYVYLIGKKMFETKAAQWLFLFIVVCLPQVGFLFTYLNCDSMALMATAMIVYYLLKGREDSFSVSTCIWLAASLSICVLSYYNAYGFLITSVLVFGGYFFEQNREGKICCKEFWKKGFLILGIVFLLVGWWFVRNYFLYDGDILGLRTQNEYAERYAIDILKPSNRRNYRNQGLSMWDMLFRSDWAISVLKSFIGVLGPLYYALRWWMYLGYVFLFLLGGLGVLTGISLQIKAWKKQKKKSSLDFSALSLHLGFIIAILIPNLLNFWYSYAMDYQPQGRYSMPMLIPFMYYVVWGLNFWMRKVEELGKESWKRLLFVVVRFICLWIAGVFLFCVVKIMWPAYHEIEDKSVVKTYTMEELFGEE